MTNFEFFKDEMIDIRKAANNISVKKNEPVECNPHNCYNCDLYDGEGKESCLTQFINWLFQEHIEKLKLTRRERIMCELLKTGWIAMDDDGSIFWYEKRPERDNNGYFNSYDSEFIALSNFKLQFDNVPIGVEAFAVEDLLRLEVEE